MKGFFVGLQFLTRLKIVNQTEWKVEDFGASVTYFPLVGLVIGAFMWGIYALVHPYIPVSLLMLLLVIFEFLFTGGLHADGFMDTCDGLFSGRDRERKLEIMKDSRVGSNGVVGFVFLTLLKWQLLVNVPEPFLPTILLTMPILSRYTMVISIQKFPYARPEGIGKFFADNAPTYAVWVSTVLALLPTLYFQWVYAFLFAIALMCNYILNAYITKHLGGTTGDTYGFVCELSEVFLILFIIIWSIV